MNIPTINLRRTYLIARRDFLGYIKTWGFWLSFFLPFIGGLIVFFVTTLDINITPTRYETILDIGGQHGPEIIRAQTRKQQAVEGQIITKFGELLLSDRDSKILKARYDRDGVEGAAAFLDEKIPGAGERIKIPQPKIVFIAPPAKSLDGLQPYLRGEKYVSHAGKNVKLSGVLHIYPQIDSQISSKPKALRMDYWSQNFNNHAVQNMAKDYFLNKATKRYLQSGGLTVEGLGEARKAAVNIEVFDPTKTAHAEGGGQEVTMRDRIPLFAAAALSVFLWLTVFSGAYMLLTSMLEEKLGKLLEMTLVSTRLSEIIFGKLLGVAALTFTAMLPYIILSSVGLIAAALYGPPEVTAGLKDALDAKMLIFFLIFLVLGYVFYGAFFIALGALAESMQDAQTITTPIILVLTASIMVVPHGLENPESPILAFATWFPFSAPFASLIRLPSNPPLWELVLSAFSLFLCALAVIWFASRMFRYGVLSGTGVKGLKDMFMRKVIRRKI